MVTVLPVRAIVPAPGDCETTRLIWRRSVVVERATATTKPAARSIEVAADCRLPTTPGTATRAGADGLGLVLRVGVGVPVGLEVANGLADGDRDGVSVGVAGALSL